MWQGEAGKPKPRPRITKHDDHALRRALSKLGAKIAIEAATDPAIYLNPKKRRKK